MAYIKTVQTYAAFLYPVPGKQSGRINLTCDDHKLYLIFRDPSDVLSPNSFDAANKTGVATLSFNLYEYYLDLVRNEKPVWVTFLPENTPPSFVVYCAQEPVGDGEM